MAPSCRDSIRAAGVARETDRAAMLSAGCNAPTDKRLCLHAVLRRLPERTCARRHKVSAARQRARADMLLSMTRSDLWRGACRWRTGSLLATVARSVCDSGACLPRPKRLCATALCSLPPAQFGAVPESSPKDRDCPTGLGHQSPRNRCPWSHVVVAGQLPHLSTDPLGVVCAMSEQIPKRIHVLARWARHCCGLASLPYWCEGTCRMVGAGSCVCKSQLGRQTQQNNTTRHSVSSHRGKPRRLVANAPLCRLRRGKARASCRRATSAPLSDTGHQPANDCIGSMSAQRKLASRKSVHDACVVVLAI